MNQLTKIPLSPQLRADLLLRNDWVARQRIRDPFETVHLCHGCDLIRESLREFCPNCEEVTDSYTMGGEQ